MIKDKLLEDIKTAMRAGEKSSLAALRLVSAAFKQYEVDNRTEVSDKTANQILTKMVKQRRESITQYEAGNRQDLVDQEQFEIDLLMAYLPEQLSTEEIKFRVISAIEDCDASSMRDMGKVMGALNTELQGKADMSTVSSLVKTLLSSN
ncbi:MAG: GatB/YqeY domain-containing protein [Gammaproteobacteria bacterium]